MTIKNYVSVNAGNSTILHIEINPSCLPSVGQLILFNCWTDLNLAWEDNSLRPRDPTVLISFQNTPLHVVECTSGSNLCSANEFVSYLRFLFCLQVTSHWWKLCFANDTGNNWAGHFNRKGDEREASSLPLPSFLIKFWLHHYGVLIMEIQRTHNSSCTFWIKLNENYLERVCLALWIFRIFFFFWIRNYGKCLFMYSNPIIFWL